VSRRRGRGRPRLEGDFVSLQLRVSVDLRAIYRRWRHWRGAGLVRAALAAWVLPRDTNPDAPAPRRRNVRRDPDFPAVLMTIVPRWLYEGLLRIGAGEPEAQAREALLDYVLRYARLGEDAEAAASAARNKSRRNTPRQGGRSSGSGAR
jgi:hypothetical protein